MIVFCTSRYYANWYLHLNMIGGPMAFLRTLTLSLATVFTLFLFGGNSSAQYSVNPQAVDSSLDSVVTILLVSDSDARPVGSGLIVRSDGYVLVPYSLVRDAREIQVRLRNGETYDKAEIVSTDERRNIAIIHMNAAGLKVIPNGTPEESQVGSRIYVVTNASGQPQLRSDLSLDSVQMADSVPGAGKGYRVLQFGAFADSIPAGGLVLDSSGRTLGMITTTPDIKGQNIAVPLSSFVGMVRAIQANGTMTIASNPVTPAQTPYPIAQGSVLMPQRGVTPLSAKGPGSVVVKPATIPEILAASKTIYVTSNTMFFKPDQLINALNTKPEMAQWGLSFTDERDLADLILELDHVLYTYKYTFKLYSQRLGTVVATGSRIIWDGNLGAPYMAERFIEKVKSVRGPDQKVPVVDDKKTAMPDKKTK
jgi:S1-C subfamily serine protease